VVLQRNTFTSLQVGSWHVHIHIDTLSVVGLAYGTMLHAAVIRNGATGTVDDASQKKMDQHGRAVLAVATDVNCCW
jgi:hypothetical protein